MKKSKSYGCNCTKGHKGVPVGKTGQGTLDKPYKNNTGVKK